MSGLFHSLLSKKHAEPECLTAQGIAARLERMFSEAASYIIIVSPYIKLNLRLRDILGEKKKAGVDITIIHKGPFTATDIATRHFQRSNLHAACFLTEKAALIGSMNLYDYSQVNNDELGIYMEKEDFPGTYATIHAEAQRLCRDFTPPPPAAKTRPARSGRKQVSLERGKYYSPEEMKKFFAFENDHPGDKKRQCRAVFVVQKPLHQPGRGWHPLLSGPEHRHGDAVAHLREQDPVRLLRAS